MNKIQVGLASAVVFILLVIGCMVYYEMTNEIANNPDIKEIGGPPVITNLGPMVVTIVILAILIFIILKCLPKEDKNDL